MPNLQPQSQVGDYILQEALDEGGQGYIWRARHAQTGALVALKLLTKPSSSGEAGQLRQDIELMAAAAANHSPNIVHVLGGSLEPVPHIVMEYIDGSDLRKELIRLRDLHGPDSAGFAQDEVVRAGLAIASALKLLHEEGIIHRDVKPANVMLDRRGNIKLTDFGIAKIIGYHSVSIYGDHPLSLAYAAPEVWSGEPVPASDIYALGATLYELVTGHPLFQGFAASLYTKHTSEKPDLETLPPGTVASLRILLERCLEKEIAARPKAETCIALLNAANAEINETLSAPEKHEPRRFGDWVILAPIASQPWAWRCVNRESRAQAILELHFVTSLAELGNGLQYARRAIDLNPRLVLHGAERLITADRVMLGPDEAWPGTAPGAFAYFVAREDAETPAPPDSVSNAGLKAIATSLATMARIATREEISLNFDASELTLVSQNSVRLAHPGLSTSSDSTSEAGLAFLLTLPLDEDTQAMVAAAPSLEALVEALGEHKIPSPDATVAGTVIVEMQSLQDTRAVGAAARKTTEPVDPESEVVPAAVVSQSSEDTPPPEQVTIIPTVIADLGAERAAESAAPIEASPPTIIIARTTTTGSARLEAEAPAAVPEAPAEVSPPVATPAAPTTPARALPGGFAFAIQPRRTSTRFKAAQFDLSLASQSEHTQLVSLQARGPDDVIISMPSQVTLAPSSTSVIDVSASARTPRWWGERRPRSFSMTAGGGDDGQPPRTLDASFNDDSRSWLPISGGLGAIVLAVLAAVAMAGGGGKHDAGPPTPSSALAVIATATTVSQPAATSTSTPTPLPAPADAAEAPAAEVAPVEAPTATATARPVPPTPRPAATPVPAAGSQSSSAQVAAPPPAPPPPPPTPTTVPSVPAGGESYSMIGFATTKVGAGTAPPDVMKSGGSLAACSSTYFYMFFTVRNVTDAKSLTFTYSVDSNRIGTYSFNTETGSHNYWFGFPIYQPRNGQVYRVSTNAGSAAVLDGSFTLTC